MLQQHVTKRQHEVPLIKKKQNKSKSATRGACTISTHWNTYNLSIHFRANSYKYTIVQRKMESITNFLA